MLLPDYVNLQHIPLPLDRFVLFPTLFIPSLLTPHPSLLPLSTCYYFRVFFLSLYAPVLFHLYSKVPFRASSSLPPLLFSTDPILDKAYTWTFKKRNTHNKKNTRQQPLSDNKNS